MKIKNIPEIEDRVYLKALNFVSYKRRSENETLSHIYTYLKKENITSEENEQIKENVLHRLDVGGYIDDYGFIEQYISESVSRAVKSKMELKKFLYGKGLASDLIEKYFLEMPDDYELKVIRTQMEKKYPKLDINSSFVAKQKAIQYFSRRGFPTDLIRGSFDSAYDMQ